MCVWGMDTWSSSVLLIAWHDDVSCANQILDQQGTTDVHRVDMTGTLIH